MIDVPDEYERVAVFDLDGTLTPFNSTFPLINQELGVEESFNQKMYEKFSAGEFTYQEWISRVVSRWKQKDASKRHFEKVFSGCTQLREGAERLVKMFEDDYTVIISGSLDMYSRMMADEIGVDAHIDTLDLVFDEGGIDGFRVYNGYIGDKEKFVKGINKELYVFGNSMNDKNMVEAADRGFMVPSDGNMDYTDIKTEIVAEPYIIAEYLRGEL